MHLYELTVFKIMTILEVQKQLSLFIYISLLIHLTGTVQSNEP